MARGPVPPRAVGRGGAWAAGPKPAAAAARAGRLVFRGGGG